MATKAHTRKGIVLLLVCAAQFMVVLDIAFVNVALPSIQHDLGIEQGTLPKAPSATRRSRSSALRPGSPRRSG